MVSRGWVLVFALLLIAVSAVAGGHAPAGDMAEGALSLLVSKRCEASREPGSKSIEFPALVYARGKPPSWGRKAVGPCRGLDTWVFSEAVSAGAYWSQNDHKAIEAAPMTTLFAPEPTGAAFKQMFGWELPERGDYKPAPDVFLKYEAKKLSALFDRLYVKPTDKLAGLGAQEVYDVLLKDFVTRFAREVAMVKADVPKAKMAKLLKDYQAAAKEGGGAFSGPTYLKGVAASALAKEGEQAARAGRTLGVVLRRTADGTWPTVTRLLKQVLADYDPALAGELKNKL